MDLRSRLSRLIAVRVVVGTLLLGSAILIQLNRPGAFPVDPFFFLIGLTYALSVAYFATLRLVNRHPWLADLQLGADALLVSGFIGLTGGIVSYFSSLYFLPIIAASTIRFRRGALQVATLSALLYLGIVMAQYVDMVPVLDGDPGAGAADLAVRAVHGRDQPVRVPRRRAAGGLAGGTASVRGCAAGGGVAPDRGPARLQRIRHRQPAERAGDHRRRGARADVQQGRGHDHGHAGRIRPSARTSARSCSCRRRSGRS